MKSRLASLLLATLAACGATDGPTLGTAHVRVAHLSPDAPNVDFCVASHGTTDFTGPLLTINGHLTGLPYGNVTKYFELASDQYDVRLVAPGAADCKTALGGLPDFTNLPPLEPDVSATIGAEGLVAFGSTTPFTLKAYIDDTSVESGKAKLRFIHASPGTPAVDIGLGGGALFASVFSDISYGNAAANTNGYVTTDAIAGAEISARAHGTLQDALAIKPAALPANAIATAYAIGVIGNTATPLRVLLCTDNAPPTGLLTPCNIVGGTPERAHVRIAHLSPDTPAVDICLAPAGSNAFDKSLLKTLGANDGLAYPQVTTYVDLPVGMYDVRIVHATASGCSIGAVPDTKNVGIHNDLTATIAAIGVLDRSGAAATNPGLSLAIFLDDTAVTAGKTKLRFIHASPGTPNVDVGLGTGTSFAKVFSNVAFGTVAMHAPLVNGFVETTPVTSPVAARLANATTDALVIPSVTLAAGSIATAIAIGGKTGASTNPLAVLWCSDNAPANGLFAACSVAH
jgi:hypothetical protein